MASIINAVANGIVGLVDEAVQLTEVILTNKHGATDSDFIPFHAGEMKGETYDPIAKFINEHFKDMTQEQAQQVYNTIKNGVEKAKLLMEKCTKKDLQFRVIRLDSTREITPKKTDVMIDTGSGRFQKAKEFFKSSSDVVYLGCVMLVKNLSPDNGNSLEISSCDIIPSNAKMTDPDSYDGEDNTFNIYNKEVYTRFIPSTSTVFYTKPISEILSQYMINPQWQDKLDDILTALQAETGISKDEIIKGADKIRCVSGVSQLKEQGIDSFDSFRQNSGGFDTKTSYVGPNVVLLNKYFKFKTSGDENDEKTTKYQITLFELFLTGKSVNLNASAKLEADAKYTISNLNEEEIHSVIDRVITGTYGEKELNEAMIKQKLNKFGSIVVKNGKFIRENDGKPLQKGEEIIEEKGEVFDL